MRVTRSVAGFGVDRPSEGRGAWLCRAAGVGTAAEPACVEQALARRAFARAWKCTLGPADEQALRELLARADDEHPDAH